MAAAVAEAEAGAGPQAGGNIDRWSVRLEDIADRHRKLLRELTRRISKRLETDFSKLPGAEGPNVGIQLREGNRKVLMELPAALLLQAETDMSAREAIRVRIKARRDRMLFRREPISLEQRVEKGRRQPPAAYGSGGGQGPPGRGRR